MKLKQSSVGKPSLEVTKGKGIVEDIDMSLAGNVVLVRDSNHVGDLSPNNARSQAAPDDPREV